MQIKKKTHGITTIIDFLNIIHLSVFSRLLREDGDTVVSKELLLNTSQEDG
jgi:hypothetical protein